MAQYTHVHELLNTGELDLESIMCVYSSQIFLLHLKKPNTGGG